MEETALLQNWMSNIFIISGFLQKYACYCKKKRLWLVNIVYRLLLSIFIEYRNNRLVAPDS